MSNSLTTFDSTKEPLSDLLSEINKGKLQLPDFQRDWVWDDHHIVSIIASICQAYPIGAVMVLNTGNPDVKFKSRLIEGVDTTIKFVAERLILDGQQRLTSLYQSLFSLNPVKTRDIRKNEIERYYYIDIRKALKNSNDLEDSIISVPSTKQIVNFRNEILFDYSTQDFEWMHEIFPLNIVFEVDKWNTWQNGYLKANGEENIIERLERWNAFFAKVLNVIQKYNVPVIKLFKETSKGAICQVFEKVNTGGVSLTVFELLTATYAIEEYNLRDDWDKRKIEFSKIKVLENLPSDYFLQGICLLTSFSKRMEAEKINTKEDDLPAVTCKRNDILRLDLKDYKKWADSLQKGFVDAAKFLHTQNIFSSGDVPYSTQIVPLASILTLAGEKMNNDSVRSKVKRWYWCGVLGELYGSANETRFAKDVYDLIKWIDGGEEATTVKDANFYPARLLSLRSRNSAAYKGLYALMMQNNGSLDFCSGENINVMSYFGNAIDIHHIFPQKWCDTNNLNPKIYNSIINKTPLSYKTNRKIGGYAPSEYLDRLRKENKNTKERQKEIVNSHIIEIEYLENDDFEGFYNGRAKAILSIISKTISKTVEIEAGKEILDL